MKFIHISDLHLGKRLGEYSLYEEQKDILQKILSAADEIKPAGVIIAGDVYNRSVPQEDSVGLFDDFLCELSSRRLSTFIISGNHDSAERIAFGSRIMSMGGVHLSPVYSGSVTPITLSDEYGELNVYMLPFIRPASVRGFFPDTEINGFSDAVRTAVEAMYIDVSARNVLVTHQFVTGASLSESEEIFVGGTENVDGDIFEKFDYVALGHIHSPQNVGGNMRYCGTPLKYSCSEAGQKKSLTVVDLGAKGKVGISTVPLTPLRDVAEYTGSFETLTDRDFYSRINTGDYVYLTLTDETPVPEAVHKLRKIYPRLVKHTYDNSTTRNVSRILEEHSVPEAEPYELFEGFYREYDPEGMTAQQEEYIRGIIKEVWEEEIL